ncbi:hypothetical protein ScPMuIL_002964 [Solemya velum]
MLYERTIAVTMLYERTIAVTMMYERTIAVTMMYERTIAVTMMYERTIAVTIMYERIIAVTMMYERTIAVTMLYERTIAVTMLYERTIAVTMLYERTIAKTGCPVLILICVMHFNLVFAKNDCADKRNKCLKACEKAQNVDVCKEVCHSAYQECIRNGKVGKKPRDKKRRRKTRHWSNPKRALTSLGLEAIQAAIRRLTFDPKIFKMGTN